jgi:hypothetical protein
MLVYSGIDFYSVINELKKGKAYPVSTKKITANKNSCKLIKNVRYYIRAKL